MKKTIAAILAATLSLFGLTACGGSNTVEEQIPPYPVTVDNITVEERPIAVASLSPALTEILLDLGYQNRIVGYPEENTIPDPLPEPEPVSSEAPPWWKFWVSKEESSAPVSDPAPSQVDKIGTAMEPDLSMVGELKPEIIFTAVPFTKAQMEKLTEVNIKVVVMPAIKTVEDLKARYLDIIKIMEGQLVSDLDGLALTDAIQGTLDYIASQVPSEKKSFLYVNTLDPLISTGDTLESALLSLIGTNLAADKKEYTVDEETLAKYDPDVIFFAAPLTAENFKDNALFKDKTAVKEGNLIEVDAASLLLQTRQVTESLRIVAEKLYPGVDFVQPEPVSSDVSGASGTAASSDVSREASAPTSSKASSSEKAGK